MTLKAAVETGSGRDTLSSAPVTLINKLDVNARTGVILFRAVYPAGVNATLLSPPQRWDALRGYVVGVWSYGTLLQAFLRTRATGHELHFWVYDLGTGKCVAAAVQSATSEVTVLPVDTPRLADPFAQKVFPSKGACTPCTFTLPLLLCLQLP